MRSFVIREFKAEDYPIIQKWWERRKHPAPPIEVLLDGYGCIVQVGGLDVMASWIYLSCGKTMATVAFTVSNPGICESRSIWEAAQHLIAVLEKIATDQGYTVILSPTGSNGLATMLKNNGWVSDGVPHQLLFKTCQPPPS